MIRLLFTLSGGRIVSLDNMNDYYDVSLKEWRLKQIEESAISSPVEHVFIKGDLADKGLIDRLFFDYKFDIVVNLAARFAPQPLVRCDVSAGEEREACAV